jgi:DNA invertase Pin-like site-specific DNA recombinase
MRCAIYARRSTEEHQAASLDVQLSEAERFAAKRGWNVVEVYTEDAVSRAEFKKRPQLIRFLLAAKERRFDVALMRDETRIGGDLYRTGMVLQDLHDAGVKIFYYATGEEVRFDDPAHKLMSAVKLYASELERIKIASRTREHLESRARKGSNVGGRVYGYDNIEVRDGERRVRVEYRINEEQAEVIREIFRMHAAGEGARGIARALNERRVPSPRAGKRGSGSWSPVSILDILRRERYRGSLVWGKESSEYRYGTRTAIEKPSAEWIRVERQELRIIDDALWTASTARFNHDGRRRNGGQPARHLLSGIARCSACGGPMQANHIRWSGVLTVVYECAWARDRGEAVCANRVRRPAKEMEGALVDWIRANVLSPAVIKRVLVETRRIVEARSSAPEPVVGPLEREAKRLQSEINRIATAIATTDMKPEALTQLLVDREGQLRTLRDRMTEARTRAALPSFRWSELETEAHRRIVELGKVIDRATLRALLRGSIQCSVVETEEGYRYRMSGEAVISTRLLAGGLEASPTSTEQTPCHEISAPFAIIPGERAA